MKRMIIGVALAGLGMFFWSALAHTVLPIGGMGIKVLHDEEAFLGAVKTSATEPGFYFFPGMDMSRKPSAEEQKAWTAKYETGPCGIMVVHPHGRKAMNASHLLTELGADLLAVGLAAWLVSPLAFGFWKRALAVTLMGPIAWLSLSASYWNWYGFPTAYVTAEAIDQVVGWFIAGLVLSAIARTGESPGQRLVS